MTNAVCFDIMGKNYHGYYKKERHRRNDRAVDPLDESTTSFNMFDLHLDSFSIPAMISLSSSTSKSSVSEKYDDQNRTHDMT